MKLLKKVLCGILSAAMLITSAVIPVMAEENITVMLDGNILYFDVPPQTINDRTMVPLRAIFEALGATVDWNDETETVTSTKGDITIQLTVNSNTMYVNGNPVMLDTPACVINDRTLVPVRAISEAYNTKVDWDEDTQTVIISSNAVPDTIPTETPADNAQVNNYTTSSYPGIVLAQAIIEKGIYLQDSNAYAILEYLDDTHDLFISCDLKAGQSGEVESIGFMLTSTSPDYKSQISLFIDEVYEPTAMLTFTDQYGEEYVIGQFSSYDGKFYITGGDYGWALEQNAADIINPFLGIVDAYMQMNDYGVTLSDFGIAYE